MLARAACGLGQPCLGHVTLPSVGWFPQEYAYEFFAAKGVLALIATLMLVVHMMLTWAWIGNWGQRLRYLALLYLAALVTAPSVKQMQESATGARLVDWPNIGAFVGMAGLIVAMTVSLVLDFERKQHPPKHCRGLVAHRSQV